MSVGDYGLPILLILSGHIIYICSISYQKVDPVSVGEYGSAMDLSLSLHIMYNPSWMDKETPYLSQLARSYY